MLNQINKRRGGFTLVEIMIVVAIIAAKSAMIATTIIISTRVKPPRRLLSLFNIANLLSIL